MTILAAIDESERSKIVIELAYDLATTYNDTLVGLHVVPKEDYDEHRESVKSIPEFRDFSFTQTEDNAEQFVEKFVKETLGDFDTTVLEPKGRIGDVSSEILNVAEDIEPRFLVISGRRQSPAGKAIFGNTAQRLLLNANCPVVSQLAEQ